MRRRDAVEGGLVGMLVGDACGVPYEFRHPAELPPLEALEMEPPAGYPRAYADVPVGTWSDDGAQALCLLASLLACGHYHAHDFANRLLRWQAEGYMAVGGYVFDIGNQTAEALARLRRGSGTEQSGLWGERNNGNGSLMRVLPLALLRRGNDLALVVDAHRQSRLTHAHPRAQVCCALYCLWARRELEGSPRPWDDAVTALRTIYRNDPVSLRELEEKIRPGAPPDGGGTGYVVDCLHSARLACQQADYPSIIKLAISLGHDTDTTACVAGGIAGIRHGIAGIPSHWLGALRGRELLDPLLEQVRARLSAHPAA